MTGCSMSPCRVQSRDKGFGVHAMFGGRRTTSNTPSLEAKHIKIAIASHRLDLLAVTSNVRDGPVSFQAYRIPCMHSYRGVSMGRTNAATQCQQSLPSWASALILPYAFKLFSVLQPHPTLQLAHRSQGYRSALE